MTAMLAFRGRPTDADRSVKSLIVACLGNFLPFALILDRRTAELTPLPALLQIGGLALALAAVFSLRTRVSIAPGNRGVCESGAYRLVRHPMYLAAIVGQLGLVLEYFSAFNFSVLLAAGVFKLAMIRNEERLLNADAQYREYRRRVGFRLIPGVY